MVSPTPLTEGSAALLRPHRPQERSCLRVRLVRSQQIGRAERPGPLSGSHEYVCLFDRPEHGLHFGLLFNQANDRLKRRPCLAASSAVSGGGKPTRNRPKANSPKQEERCERSSLSGFRKP